MKKRGLSPVIATVLLIAIVIVLGLIVFLWLRGITQEAITKFGGQNVQLVCNNVQFDASYSSGNISISNTGNVPIYEFKAKISGAGSYSTVVIGNSTSWPKVGLNPGDVYQGPLNTTGATSLTIIPVLIGKTQSSGDQTYTCPDSQGKEVSLS